MPLAPLTTWLTHDARWKRILAWTAVAVLPGGVVFLPYALGTFRKR